MGRKNRRDPSERQGRPLSGTGTQSIESFPDGQWYVRRLSGSTSDKAYRCPGCDQEIVPATAHVVAWPVDDVQADSRRHWHTPCWKARTHRGPNLKRPGRAPWY